MKKEQITRMTKMMAPITTKLVRQPPISAGVQA